MDVDTETSQGETIAGGTTTTSLVPPCEPNQLQDYFDKLLPLVLGAESDLTLWSLSETTEKLTRFINDPQVNVIFFTKKRDDKKEEGKFT
jgi:hypothetical protein